MAVATTGSGLALVPRANLVTPYTADGKGNILEVEVCPGDRVTIKNVQISDASPAGANIGPDSDNMLPYLVYKPEYGRLADYSRGSRKRENSMFGTDSNPPLVRVSLSSSIYCPFAGKVYCTGGAPVPGGAPAMVLAVTFAVSRNCRAELNQRNTLALYNIQTYDPNTGAPIRIARPDFTKTLWTPDTRTVTLDFGPGTASVTQVVNFAQPIDVGPFPFFFFPLPGTTPPIVMLGMEI